MVIAIALSELNLFVYCYYGYLATDCYLKMADLLFESEWYNQHLEEQQMYGFMIQNAQRSYHYHGFRIMTLNLDTYVKVSCFWELKSDVMYKRYFVFVFSDTENNNQLLHDV